MGSWIRVGAIAAFALGASARAQQTVFNVPSPDVLERGTLYLETDQYLQRWRSDVDDVGFGLVRGVCGVGSGVEVGLNAGPFDYEHRSTAFLDAAVKWRPGTGGGIGLFLGNNLGANVNGDPDSVVRDYAYAETFVSIPDSRTRISAGPYYATRNYFAPEDRFGAQCSIEQPIPEWDGVTLAADWISGDGGAATAGVVWAARPLTFYVGYGFANSGRDADALTLELGITF